MSQPFSPSAKAITFLVTRDRAKAEAFYGGTLGFKKLGDDPFAAVFDLNGTMLRISEDPAHQPAKHTVLGWEVADISASMQELKSRGVQFTLYDALHQDAAGVWRSPTGAQVAWFLDPDGNNLSLTQF